MTTPFGPARIAPGLPQLPTPPTGWPVGSYATYEEAQRAVDHLADSDFPVGDVTIVGVDLMLVERVIARLTWGRVLFAGAASGAWLGLFVGLILALLAPGTPVLGALLLPLGIGILFGLVSAAVAYGAAAGVATSPPPARWSPGATTCCASPATPRRPASCSPSWRWAPPADPRDKRRLARGADDARGWRP